MWNTLKKLGLRFGERTLETGALVASAAWLFATPVLGAVTITQLGAGITAVEAVSKDNLAPALTDKPGR